MSIMPCKLPLTAVIAATPNFGIGTNGTLPWLHSGIELPKDMAHFKHSTSKTTKPGKQNAVIMGKATWLSIPEKFRPLSDRVNIVISHSMANEATDNIYIASSLSHALNLIQSDQHLSQLVESVMVIGGVRLFEESLKHPWFERLYLTTVETSFDCDTFLSEETMRHIQEHMAVVSTSEPIVENEVTYRILEMVNTADQ